jgi:HTH-type transcriptional regulator / antitoxin HigA
MLYPVSDKPSHVRALKRIEQLWDAAPDTPEALELDALATLVDAYERKTFPIPPLDPVEAIKQRCEDLGWSRRELEALIGTRARVSEVLSGKRALTLAMIRKLHEALGLPADVLIAQPAKRPLARTSGHGTTLTKATQLRFAADKRRKASS